MARLISPTGINFGSSTMPDACAVDVEWEDIMPSDGLPVYTRQVLSSPSLDQLANLSAGYAL